MPVRSVKMTPQRVVVAVVLLAAPITSCGEDNRATTPSLTTPVVQRELFDALDLSSEQLKPVCAAVGKDDYTTAERALARYYRSRTSVPWTFDPQRPARDPNFKDPVAEDAANGKVTGGLVQPWHTFPGNKIDWLYNATVVTRILFLKPDIFVVADTLMPNDKTSHTYEARWHLLTTKTQIDKTTNVLVTADPGLPNMAIVPLSTNGLEVSSASGVTKPQLLGWNVRKDLVPEYVPATTLLHTLTGTGPQCFLTLFLPLRPNAPNPVVRVDSKTPGSAIVVFACGRQLNIAADLGATGGITITETMPKGAPGRQVNVPHRS